MLATLALLGSAAARDVPLAASPIGTSSANNLVIGDFDRNGALDVVTGSTGSILVHAQLGGFAQRTVSTGVTPTRIVSGDFDGDGDLDLAATVGSEVRFYRNDDPSGLSNWADLLIDDVEDAYGALVAADFDDDGDLDLIAAGAGASGERLVTLAWNSGGFDVSRFPVPGAIVDLALGDVDHDGDPDLVVGTGGSGGAISWSDEGGAIETLVPNINVLGGLVAGDLDGDGEDEIAAVVGTEGLQIFEDNGGWVLADTVDSSVAVSDTMAVGDIDGDGDLDIAGANSWWDNDGSWTDHPAGSGPAAIADIDDDGDNDIVTGGPGTAMWFDNRAIHFGPDFVAPVEIGADGSLQGPTDIAVDDIDGDGVPDLVVAWAFSGDVAWVDAAGVQHEVGSGTPGTYVATGDFDGDGDIDIAVSSDDAFSGWENAAGDGLSWTGPQVLESLGTRDGAEIAAYDMDRDGAVDLVASSDGLATGQVAIYYDDSGGFVKSVETGLHPQVTSIAVADFDRDGWPDIASAGGPLVQWFAVDPVSSWTGTLVDGLAGGARYVRAGDLDEDGDADLIVSASGIVRWYRNDGLGNFTYDSDIIGLSQPGQFELIDIDRDGHLDVVVPNVPLGEVAVVYNLGGTGQSWQTLFVSGIDTPFAATAADRDGDGDLDVFAIAEQGDQILTWENQGPQAFVLPSILVDPTEAFDSVVTGLLHVETLHGGLPFDDDMVLDSITVRFEVAPGTPATGQEVSDFFDAIHLEDVGLSMDIATVDGPFADGDLVIDLDEHIPALGALDLRLKGTVAQDASVNSVGSLRVSIVDAHAVQADVDLVIAPFAIVSTVIQFADSDGDGVYDVADNCPDDDNPLQENGDTDDWGDACDCDDADGDIFPGAAETCDGVDSDCDGTAELDGDNDSFLACEECDDGDDTVNPDATEIPGDDIDNDCDGQHTCYDDFDGDGYAGDTFVTKIDVGLTCLEEGLWITVDDCDDDNDQISPDATELGGGVDENCDGVWACFVDDDRDGVGDDDLVDSTDDDCGDPGESDRADDCDDDRDDVSPLLSETCDNRDNDCDGTVDEGFPDDDGDGVRACGGDCDDSDDTISPEFDEVCDNGVDDDCDDDVDAADSECSLGDDDDDDDDDDDSAQPKTDEVPGHPICGTTAPASWLSLLAPLRRR